MCSYDCVDLAHCGCETVWQVHCVHSATLWPYTPCGRYKVWQVSVCQDTAARSSVTHTVCQVHKVLAVSCVPQAISGVPQANSSVPQLHKVWTTMHCVTLSQCLGNVLAHLPHTLTHCYTCHTVSACGRVHIFVFVPSGVCFLSRCCLMSQCVSHTSCNNGFCFHIHIKISLYLHIYQYVYICVWVHICTFASVSGFYLFPFSSFLCFFCFFASVMCVTMQCVNMW